MRTYTWVMKQHIDYWNAWLAFWLLRKDLLTLGQVQGQVGTLNVILKMLFTKFRQQTSSGPLYCTVAARCRYGDHTPGQCHNLSIGACYNQDVEDNCCEACWYHERNYLPTSEDMFVWKINIGIKLCHKIGRVLKLVFAVTSNEFNW